MKTLQLILMALLAATIGILAAWLHWGTCRPEGDVQLRGKGRPLERITLAYVPGTHAVLTELALHQGHFRQEGLEVTERRHPFGKSALEDVLQGNADFATVADTPIMTAIMIGEKVHVIATVQTSNKANAIVARKDADIRGPANLKGKRIAAALGTTSDFFLDVFLDAHGIDRKNVEKVDLKPGEFLDALAHGHVDAVSAFQPFLVEMEKSLSRRVVSFYDENIYTWTFSLVATQEFTGKNPEKVRKFLRALVKAEEFAAQAPAEAQAIMAGFSGMDTETIRELWPRMRLKVTLDQFLVLALEDESRWAINSGRIPRRQIPNYLDFIYFDGLESVKPKAVNILK